MRGEAKAKMLTYIDLNDEGAQPGVDAINSYSEAVQWLLLTYAHESVLHDAYCEVRDMMQGVGEKEQQFAARLREAAIRCGDVFKEQDLITIYVVGCDRKRDMKYGKVCHVWTNGPFSKFANTRRV